MEFRTRKEVDEELAGHARTHPGDVRKAMEPWRYEHWTASDLRAARIAIGMTVEAAANLLGYHWNTYWQWEVGRAYPRSIQTRRAISEFIAESRLIMEMA